MEKNGMLNKSVLKYNVYLCLLADQFFTSINHYH